MSKRCRPRALAERLGAGAEDISERCSVQHAIRVRVEMGVVCSSNAFEDGYIKSSESFLELSD